METPISKAQAAEDFNKARTLAFLSKISNILHPEQDKLLSFDDVRKILKPGNEVYRGVQIVPISLIVGSEGRYQDFNKYFLPKSDYLRTRWERVDEALLDSIILPPIRLYEIGGVYFVRDGNHRVSVAKSQGVMNIDAEVTSLGSAIKLKPGMTVEQLKQAVIAHEKQVFNAETDFENVTGCKTLTFSMTGRYDVVCEHILVHKYFININVDKEIDFKDAMLSWYNHVYKPIIQIINDDGICKSFPGRTPSDLYLFIVKRWDHLKQKYGNDFPAEKAALDFKENFGKKKAPLFGAVSKQPLSDPTDEQLEE